MSQGRCPCTLDDIAGDRDVAKAAVRLCSALDASLVRVPLIGKFFPCTVDDRPEFIGAGDEVVGYGHVVG